MPVVSLLVSKTLFLQNIMSVQLLIKVLKLLVLPNDFYLRGRLIHT